MTVERSTLGSEYLASRPLTDAELEQRYGRGGYTLRRSDDWFELYEEPPVELPLSPRRKYLLPLVGLLVVGAAVLAGYALQKNDWRAVTQARTALRQTFGPKLPPMAEEPAAVRYHVNYQPPERTQMVVRLSTALAEVSYEREATPPEAAEVEQTPEPRTAPARPAPRPRRARRAEPEPVPLPPPRREGSPVIEAPMVPALPPEPALEPPPSEAPSVPPPSEPTEPGPEDEPNPYDKPATPPERDYGI